MQQRHFHRFCAELGLLSSVFTQRSFIIWGGPCLWLLLADSVNKDESLMTESFKSRLKLPHECGCGGRKLELWPLHRCYLNKQSHSCLHSSSCSLKRGYVDCKPLGARSVCRVPEAKSGVCGEQGTEPSSRIAFVSSAPFPTFVYSTLHLFKFFHCRKWKHARK